MPFRNQFSVVSPVRFSKGTTAIIESLTLSFLLAGSEGFRLSALTGSVYIIPSGVRSNIQDRMIIKVTDQYCWIYQAFDLVVLG
jgi:hypothetical protein